MPVPFKKDPTDYNQRQLLATNVFDLLSEDDDCFIYEDIFSTIDTKEVEKKFSTQGSHAYHPRLISNTYLFLQSGNI